MIEEKIEITTTDGISHGFLCRPEGSQRWPGVIHLTDIGGIRPSQHEMAQRLAAQGYCVLVPNVFYRTGRPPLFEPGSRPGGEGFMKRFAELASPLTPQAVERDASGYVDFLAGLDSVIPEKLGVVGYCFTGGLALRVAAARPGKIAAAASFHGSGLYTEAPSSPHLLLPLIKAQLYLGHAVQDRSMPEEAIQKLDQALAEWGGQYESEIYDGAFHGWTVPDTPVYNQPQAERAFANLRELFARTLK
jgi:carboxymethylenebutenolidase